MSNKHLTPQQKEELFIRLEKRFEKYPDRHPGIKWVDVQERLESNPEKCWSIYLMEESEGEPDVIGFEQQTGLYLFCDCSAESPKGRRSICYDHEALASRKEHKPKNSAIQMAAEMGIEILSEEQYRALQQLGKFDAKTSSWVLTPNNIRELGGAIFGDFRFGQVFIYHNGAESYYGARGFRGLLKV